MMLGQVVSRVRIHFRRSKARLQQPPDLRRFSDFESPFPRVSPGGYTKYYEKHGMPKPRALPADAHNSSSTTLVISKPTRKGSKSSTVTITIPPSPSESSHSPSSSHQSSPASTSSSRKRPRTLSIMREGSLSTIDASPNIRDPDLTNTPSLRRRRARLLRTPSVERTFPAAAPKMTLLPGRPASDDPELFSDEPSPSDFLRTDGTHETPPTSSDAIQEGLLLFKIDGVLMSPEAIDRPESWSSYATAKSNFSDD